MGMLLGGPDDILPPPCQASEIWVPTRVYDVPMSFLLDTGTSHTIMTLESYLLIPEKLRPRLESPDVVLKQATGSQVKVWGRALVEIRVADSAVKMPVVVGQVVANMLGMDFLKELGGKLDFRTLLLEWEGGFVECAGWSARLRAIWTS